MKLYLNNKEKSFEFLRLLDTMLTTITESGKIDLPTLELITQTKHILDPVQDFIEYYIQDTNQQLQFNEGRIQWIKNALYSSKGAPEIFEILMQTLGFRMVYRYDFPVLEILRFDELAVSDVVLFSEKFNSMIYQLLFYTSVSLTVRRLVINLIDELYQNNYIGIKGFINLTSELDTNGFNN